MVNPCSPLVRGGFPVRGRQATGMCVAPPPRRLANPSAAATADLQGGNRALREKRNASRKTGPHTQGSILRFLMRQKKRCLTKKTGETNLNMFWRNAGHMEVFTTRILYLGHEWQLHFPAIAEQHATSRETLRCREAAPVQASHSHSIPQRFQDFSM